MGKLLGSAFQHAVFLCILVACSENGTDPIPTITLVTPPPTFGPAATPMPTATPAPAFVLIPDADGVPASTTESDEMVANRFAPILRMHSEEIYMPADVAILIDNSSIVRRVSIEPRKEINAEATHGLLQRYDDETDHADYALDLKAVDLWARIQDGDSQDDTDAAYEDWYSQVEGDYDLTVYATVLAVEDKTAVQYWFFYPFNHFLNSHEGDWEMIQLVFGAGSTMEIIETDLLPVYAAYSQHLEGTREEVTSRQVV